MQYGLIGEKLSHSFSKTVHNEICDYLYELKEIPKENFDNFMKKRDFKAINVTIPYKQEIIPYLDEISDQAKKIGAVNTVINKSGRLYGYNTDFLGLDALLDFANIDLSGKKVLILGSGGTSKTAFAVAEEKGAKTVFRVSRSGSAGLITYDEAYKNHNDADIIVNTTPCGMYPNIDGCAVDINCFKKLSGVVDAVYNPLKTELVLSAEKNGIKAVGGLYMLVAQAVFAAEFFLDKKIEKTEIERVYKKLLKQKQNLVLIGMPSCGKTTVGKAVAESIGMEFIDTDDEIVKKAGKSIPQFFSEKGENAFRQIESEVIAEIALKQGCVIATGGGAVLNRRNVDYLKANGKIIFIDRPLEKLITTSDRPLSSDREALEKRYNERYPIYCESADVIIESKSNVKATVKAVTEVMK